MLFLDNIILIDEIKKKGSALSYKPGGKYQNKKDLKYVSLKQNLWNADLVTREKNLMEQVISRTTVVHKERNIKHDVRNTITVGWLNWKCFDSLM